MSHCLKITSRRLRLLVMAGAVLFCAAAASGAEGGGQINPGDIGYAIASLVVFLMLLVVLGRWAWKPIISQLHRREQGIADALRRSEEREKQAQELLAMYRSRLEAAEKEAQELINRGRRDAAEAREGVLTTAREEGQRMIASAREEIEGAKNSALCELEAQAADLATDLAEHLISKSLRDEDYKRLISESLREIENRSEGSSR